MSEVHAQARTTPRTRAEIKASAASLVELAERYNISVATARKWKRRDSPEDLSHRPHKLCTTLTPAQEAIVVALRSLTLLPLDDLVAVVREFIHPDVSRSGLDRCLRRHGVGNLRQLQAEALADAGEVQPPVKTFKDYEPGFLHMDIKYLPQMPDEQARRYLFVAIDRATRWVFMHIYADQSERSSVDFLNRLERSAPMKIVKLLTDNGSQFTDRFTSKKREPTERHVFDVRCAALNIEHRLCPPRHPQTNGMVERFNGRISEVVRQTRFASAAELETTLERYLKTYNQQIPQRALNHRSPVQALKEWQQKKPELFKKRVYNQAGLDSEEVSTGRAISTYIDIPTPGTHEVTAIVRSAGGKVGVAKKTVELGTGDNPACQIQQYGDGKTSLTLIARCTVQQGVMSSYKWLVNGKQMPSTSYMLTFARSDLDKGVSTVELTAYTDKGQEGSASWPQ